jgi:hypothetical protein
MPTEGGEYHADIRPWYSHAGDIRLDVTKKRVRENRNVVQVPWVLGIRVHRMCLKSRHSAANDKEKKSVHSALSIVHGSQKKNITFRAWWNAHQHRTRSPPFRAAIVRGAKTRARRHTLSRRRHQTCSLWGLLCSRCLVQGDVSGTTSAELAVACLKTRQRMLLPLVESKIPPSAEYASRAKPLPARHGGKRGFQAEHVKSWGDVNQIRCRN